MDNMLIFAPGVWTPDRKGLIFGYGTMSEIRVGWLSLEKGSMGRDHGGRGSTATGQQEA